MRKEYFVDTGLLIALAAPRDRLHAQALSVAQRVRDDEASLTDCLSFVVMRARGLAEALSADHHFEQLGFAALLRPA